MSQITLRKLPEKLEDRIRELAQTNRTSLNKTIIELLESALGSGKKKRDLSQLSNSWTREEAEAFTANTKVFEQIDPEIWKQ